MRYTIESTKNGCVETIELGDGSRYVKNHKRTEFGSQCLDSSFSEQMEQDGICEEILDKVDETFDGLMALDFMQIAELDY